MENNITITISILSHNHANYVAKAIESVLSQGTSYTYELFLFDDASKDGTQEILKKYQQQYPEKIKLFLFDKSEGPIFRVKQICENSKGKYLAWIDGDDYWTYPLKLQKQLDFLETHSEYNGCFHDAEIVSTIDANGNDDVLAKRQTQKKYKYYSQFNHYEPDFYPYHLILRNIIPTASLIVRKRNFDDFFKRYNFPPYSFSWAFQLHIIQNSKFYYINECWSVYLDHAEGISKKISSEQFTLNNIRVLKWYKHDDFYKKYKNKIFLSIAHEYEILAYKEAKYNLKFGYWMQWYYFKAWKCMAWWYVLNLLKKGLNK
jgi:glycosyltransferase involved in cell wall biosynthesis